MSDLTMAEELADFAAGLSCAALPPDVVEGVQARVLDIVGLYCASGDTDAARAVRTWVRETGGNGRSTAVGLPTGVPAAQAALLGGVLAHALDYDDTHLPSILHPSATVIPAALAVAEEVSADGPLLVEAIAAGLEICVRLGMAGFDADAGNSLFFEHGQHATAICGTVGAAAAAAKLYGAGAADIMSAMGIAASQASGVIEANRTGGTVKQLHCGWSAHAGVIAARLASLGITGPPTVFEGRFGFFRAFLHREPFADEVREQLGDLWRLREIHFKPYPTNHFTHAGIDGMLRLRAAGLTAGQVEHIELGVAGPTVRTIGEPIEVKRRPTSGYSAKFSGPYTLAVTLLGGAGLGVGHADFTDDHVQDAACRSLMDTVTVVADDWCDARYPWALPAVLRVHTRDGSVLTEQVAHNRGGPHNPLTAEELQRKFTDNADRTLDAQDSEALVRWSRGLRTAVNATEALHVLRAAGV